MPRFTPSVREASAGIPLLDDGEYEFEIGQPKGFNRMGGKDKNTPVFGVAYGLLVKSGPSNVGKTIPYQVFLHSVEGLGFSKRFLMSALGYDPRDSESESAFNERFSDDAFAIDTDNLADIGEIYNRVAGQTIAAGVTQKLNKPTDGSAPQMQNQFAWKPIG